MMPINKEDNKITKLTEDENESLEEVKSLKPYTKCQKIVYKNILVFGYGHIAAVYGLYLCFASAKWQSVLLGFILAILAEIGVTVGAHRLWTHRAFKAKMPFQILLMILNSIAFQNSIITWVRDHRMHHKYTDTDADPHNATRGFFYSHVGWLLMKKHPEVIRLGHTIDMSDITNNSVLKFQKKYAIPLIGSICFLLPTILPMYLWGESLNNAWHLTMLRYVWTLNVTFLVNSAAHLWGNKPYDKNIMPAQNLYVSFLAVGEGFHNYHHVFPWDYRTAELGNNKLNLSTYFIDFFAGIGWAYDLKTVTDNVVRARAMRTGDSTNSWGWGDKTQSLGQVNHNETVTNR